MEDLEDADIYDNKIFSNIEGATGYSSGAAANFINNVTIRQTTKDILVNVTSDPFKFVGINKEDDYTDYTFSIENNVVTSPNTSTFSSRGIVFNNNVIKEGGIRLSNAQNMTLTNNSITTTTSNAVRIDSGCIDISITDNVFNTLQSCIYQNNTDAVNVTINNNNCLEN